METLRIKTGMIRLSDALKLSGICSTGGHAKVIVQEGLIEVNGAVDTRRGRKLQHGDRVVRTDNGEGFVIGQEGAG